VETGLKTTFTVKTDCQQKTVKIAAIFYRLKQIQSMQLRLNSVPSFSAGNPWIDHFSPFIQLWKLVHNPNMNGRNICQKEVANGEVLNFKFWGNLRESRTEVKNTLPNFKSKLIHARYLGPVPPATL
jgi:hypothetical protein